MTYVNISIGGDVAADVLEVAQGVLNQRPFLQESFAGLEAKVDDLKTVVEAHNAKRTTNDEVADATRERLLPAVEETVQGLNAWTPDK